MPPKGRTKADSEVFLLPRTCSCAARSCARRVFAGRPHLGCENKQQSSRSAMSALPHDGLPMHLSSHPSGYPFGYPFAPAHAMHPMQHALVAAHAPGGEWGPVDTSACAPISVCAIRVHLSECVSHAVARASAHCARGTVVSDARHRRLQVVREWLQNLALPTPRTEQVAFFRALPPATPVSYTHLRAHET